MEANRSRERMNTGQQILNDSRNDSRRDSRTEAIIIKEEAKRMVANANKMLKKQSTFRLTNFK